MNKPANKTVFISMFHDTRREKENGLYPVKLRVFYKSQKKQKLYSTKFEFNKKDFQSIWLTLKPRQEFKQSRNEMQALLSYAEGLAELQNPFTFELFEKKLFSKSNEAQNVFHWYNSIILRLRENKQFGTANNYELCYKSLKDFLKSKTGRLPTKLQFIEITSQFLEGYEKWMKEDRKRSVTTVSIYIRTLRTVFNTAIDAKEIEKEIYPFGKRKYQVPAAKNIKKALSAESLKKLFEAVPQNFEEERAKDLFFFSYFSSGMNTKDIAELKFENIKDDTLHYIRAKTANTAKANLKHSVAYLTKYTQNIIKKYSNTDRHPENYVFPFLSRQNSAYENYRKVKNLTTSINHSIKRLAKRAGITENISTYTARHSFATIAVRNGASMEFISEALSHSNLRTTQSYFAGFEEDKKREFTERLTNFNSV